MGANETQLRLPSHPTEQALIWEMVLPGIAKILTFVVDSTALKKRSVLKFVSRHKGCRVSFASKESNEGSGVQVPQSGKGKK